MPVRVCVCVWCEWGLIMVNTVATEDLPEKVTLEYRPEGGVG